MRIATLITMRRPIQLTFSIAAALLITTGFSRSAHAGVIISEARTAAEISVLSIEGSSDTSVGPGDLLPAGLDISAMTDASILFLDSGENGTATAMSEAVPLGIIDPLLVGSSISLSASASATSSAPPPSFGNAGSAAEAIIDVANGTIESFTITFGVSYELFANVEFEDPAFDDGTALALFDLFGDDDLVIDQAMSNSALGGGEDPRMPPPFTFELEVPGSGGIGDPIQGSVLVFTEATAFASSDAPQVVPEPTSLAIFGFGAIGMVGIGIRRRKQEA